MHINEGSSQHFEKDLCMWQKHLFAIMPNLIYIPSIIYKLIFLKYKDIFRKKHVFLVIYYHLHVYHRRFFSLLLCILNWWNKKDICFLICNEKETLSRLIKADKSIKKWVNEYNLQWFDVKRNYTPNLLVIQIWHRKFV